MFIAMRSIVKYFLHIGGNFKPFNLFYVQPFNSKGQHWYWFYEYSDLKIMTLLMVVFFLIIVSAMMSSYLYLFAWVTCNSNTNSLATLWKVKWIYLFNSTKPNRPTKHTNSFRPIELVKYINRFPTGRPWLDRFSVQLEIYKGFGKSVRTHF